MPDRITQINALLQQEISLFFQEAVPHIFVSVTRVQTSPNLHDSRVWVSFLDKRGSQMEELKSYLRELHKTLGKRLRLKRIPRIELVLDTGIEYAEHISELLQENENK